VQGTLGVRTTLIRSSAFDPFSGRMRCRQLSLSIAHPLLRSGFVRRRRRVRHRLRP
jgi:hypothetical protein